jgi:single-strand DNA-binding protein
MTNVVVLRGRVNRPPVEKVLPSGDRLAAIDVTVPGGVVGATTGRGTRSESVPLAWFGAPAWVAALEPGTEILVAGRVRRRFFRAGESTQSRTEVVVEQAAPLRHVTKCVALLRRVAQEIAAADPAYRSDDADPARRRRAEPPTSRR